MYQDTTRFHFQVLSFCRSAKEIAEFLTAGGLAVDMEDFLASLRPFRASLLAILPSLPTTFVFNLERLTWNGVFPVSFSVFVNTK